jgi:hypothetical protein
MATRRFLRRNTLAFDPFVLPDAYERQCQTRMTSAATIQCNLLRGKHLAVFLGDPRVVTQTDILDRKPEHRSGAGKPSTLNSTCCASSSNPYQTHGWWQDNPARTTQKLPYKLSCLPKAEVNTETVLRMAAAASLG